MLGVKRGSVRRAEVSRVSVDARHGRPSLVYTVAVELWDEGAELSYEGFAPSVSLARPMPFAIPHGAVPLAETGGVRAWPAGLFAALVLAQAGFAPLVLERGPAMEKRADAVQAFEQTGALQPEANIQFGEGGAGTFSDGKLTTRIHDPLCAFVKQTLLAHGAPPEVAWQQKPHVGTDRLRGVIQSIRREIECLGGEVRFETKLTGLAAARMAAFCGGAHRGGRYPVRRTGAGAWPLCARHLFHAGGRGLCPAGKAVFRGLSGRAPAGGYRARAVPRGGGPSGFAARGIPAEPACGRALCVYVLHVPGRAGGGRSQRGGRAVTNGMSFHARGQNANAAVVVSGARGF